MFVVLGILPLLAIPLIVYNLMVFGYIGSVNDVEAWLAQPVFTLHMFSGDAWHVSAGDTTLILGALLLFVEVVKSTRTDAISLINHALGVMVFIVYVYEFLTLRGFSNSVFGMLCVFQLIDVIAGYTVTAVAAKRDIGAAGGIIGTH